MKILIQNSYPATPHFETELEIALSYLLEGHEVYFIAGISHFKHCFFNPKNSIYRKILAKNIFDRGIKVLKSKAPKNARLFILEYPKVSIAKSIYPNIKSISDLKKYTYEGLDLGMATASSIISYKREHKLKTAENKNLINNAFYTSVFAYESLKILLQQEKFDKVFIFNGRFVENRPLLRLCQNYQIPYATHERGGLLDNFLIRENDIPHSIPTAIREIETLWNDGEVNKVEIGSQFFINRRNKVQQGWYSYVNNQKKDKLPDGFDSSKKNLVIFNSSIDEYEGIDGYSNHLYKDENVAIFRICKELSNRPDIKIFIRVHPNLKGLNNSQINELSQISKINNNLTIIGPDENVDSYSLMAAAKIILTFGSTMGIEAAFWNKPVIFAGRSFAEKLNCFYKPTSHEELMNLILSDNLTPLNNLDAIKYGYWEQNYGQKFLFYKPSTVTSGKFLDDIVGPTGIFSLIQEIKLLLKRFKL